MSRIKEGGKEKVIKEEILHLYEGFNVYCIELMQLRMKDGSERGVGKMLRCMQMELG